MNFIDANGILRETTEEEYNKVKDAFVSVWTYWKGFETLTAEEAEAMKAVEQVVKINGWDKL